MRAVERVGDDEPEHGVPEELEALVGGQAAVLVRERPMSEGAQQHLGIVVRNPELGGEFFRCRAVRSHVPAQTSRTCRLLYVPQVGHATWGSLGSRHWGHVVR